MDKMGSTLQQVGEHIHHTQDVLVNSRGQFGKRSNLIDEMHDNVQSIEATLFSLRNAADRQKQ